MHIDCPRSENAHRDAKFVPKRYLSLRCHYYLFALQHCRFCQRPRISLTHCSPFPVEKKVHRRSPLPINYFTVCFSQANLLFGQSSFPSELLSLFVFPARISPSLLASYRRLDETKVNRHLNEISPRGRKLPDRAAISLLDHYSCSPNLDFQTWSVISGKQGEFGVEFKSVLWHWRFFIKLDWRSIKIVVPFFFIFMFFSVALECRL